MFGIYYSYQTLTLFSFLGVGGGRLNVAHEITECKAY